MEVDAAVEPEPDLVIVVRAAKEGVRIGEGVILFVTVLLVPRSSVIPKRQAPVQLGFAAALVDENANTRRRDAELSVEIAQSMDLKSLNKLI